MDFAERIKQNWKAGLTVSLVSLPLSVALAVASQTTPAVGIITAIWAGLFAAIFGGSNYNIVGPTAALSGVLGAFALQNGPELLPMVAIFTGVFTLLGYALKVERFLTFVPGSAMLGFTLGVAFTIAFGQFANALGLAGLPQHERFVHNLEEGFRHIGSASGAATAVFLVSLAGLFAMLKFKTKVPPAIAVAVAGIGLGYLTSTDAIGIDLITLGQKFTDIKPVIAQVPKFAISEAIVTAALTVSVIAILETIISAKIADGMTKTRYNERREMLGLGMANLASGLMGGIPATAALARTSLNVKTGATHRTAAGINAVAVGVIALVFLAYFKYIPMPIVASILFFTAYRMIEMDHLVRTLRHDRMGLIFALIVAVITVVIDPIMGILVGSVLGLLRFVERMSRGQFDLWMNSKDRGLVGYVSGDSLAEVDSEHDVMVYSIKGQLTYINSRSHVSRFESGVDAQHTVILRLRELHFVDEEGLDALNDIIELCTASGKEVYLSGVTESLAEQLGHGCYAFEKLKKKGLVFDKASAALRHAGVPVDASLKSA